MSSELLNPGFNCERDFGRHNLLARIKFGYNPVLARLVSDLTVGDQIGHGKQKVAYALDDRRALLLFNLNTGEGRIRKEFYERKLMHAIFPRLVPDVHLGVFSPPLLVVDRVYEHSRRLGIDHHQFGAAHSDTVRKFAGLGLVADTLGVNYAINSFGEAVYLDSTDHASWDMDKLTRGLGVMPHAQAHAASSYLSRLTAISG